MQFIGNEVYMRIGEQVADGLPRSREHCRV